MHRLSCETFPQICKFKGIGLEGEDMKKTALRVVFLVLLIGTCLIGAVSSYGNSDIKLIYVGEGAAFSIYKIGSYDSGGGFVPEEAFNGYSVDLEEESSALTLAIYIKRDGIEPLMTALTDSKSEVIFNNLDCGVYLIAGEDYISGNTLYKAKTVIATVTDLSVGQIEIEEKYSVTDITEDEGSTSVSVMKVWSGEKGESITAQLLKDGAVYDEVVLNDSNNWSYTWSGLSDSSVWYIAEKEVPDGYTLRVDENGSVFILVNTEDSDEPGGSGTTEGQTEATTDENPETTTKESGGGGGSETTTAETETEATTDTETEATTEKEDSEEPTTSKPSGGGGGGGGGYYPPEDDDDEGDDDTEETTSTPPGSPGSGSPDGTPPGSSSGSSGGSSGSESSGSDSSADISSQDISDSQSSSTDISDDSSDMSISSGEQSAAGAPPENSSGSLPQTGQLWYPVPILLWGGIIFLILGIRRRSIQAV